MGKEPLPPQKRGEGDAPKGRVEVDVKEGATSLLGGTWLAGLVGPYLGDLKSRGEFWVQLYFYARARRYEVDG